MLSRSSSFDDYAKGNIRPITWEFIASFPKDFDYDVAFFTLDTSTLDGTDILASEDSLELQEWDKYSYNDYSARVMQIEWQREESIPYSVNMATADVKLLNIDNYFTNGDVAKMESFYDNFDDPVIDPAKWINWGGNHVVLNNGQVEITAGPEAEYYGINTQYGFDLTGSYASCELVDAGNQSLTKVEVTPVEFTNLIDRNDSMKISVENGTVYCFKVVNTVATNLYNVAYNSSVHKFFRIRESGGTTYWEYSTNGTSWTTMYSEANPFEITRLEYQFYAGFWDTDVSGTTAIFDNVNCLSNGERSGNQVISPISSFNLPRRPIRLYAGFDGENIPAFVGLTEKAPQIDKTNNTATLHAVDFLSFLFNKPLDQAVMFTNIKTHTAISNLLVIGGLSTSQFSLDTGYNTINFLYFEKGTKIGDAIRKLVQAEIGTFFMDELGVIRFRNRDYYAPATNYSFDLTNVIDYNTSSQDDIINVVEVKSNVREVQAMQVVYSLVETIRLLAGETKAVFFSFEDPVTTLDTIDAYEAFSNEDGSGTNLTANISVTDTDLFTTSVKITLQNTGGVTAYITKLNILGTPARVVREIYVREQDDDSVDKFEQKVMTIENDFIQDDDMAQSIALTVLNYYNNYADKITLDVKGNFALQLGDKINVAVDNFDRQYQITKISNIIEPTRFRQRLEARVFDPVSYFKLDVSELDMADVIGV